MTDHTVICPECSKKNAAGSKFCNHCGARLPKSTNIICPRCQTPNPHDRFYCDNCGMRLVTDQPVEEPDTASEEPGPSKVFSLPARQPGDTGELDPNAVPDWLRTGQPQNQPPDESATPENNDESLRLEDLRPKNRHTDDLPDWLVNEEDDNPIIHAPTIITTEHYEALLRPSEPEDSVPVTSDILGENAADALPDWLSLSSQESGAGDSGPLINDDDMAWLANLGQPHHDDTEPATAVPDKPVAAEEDLDWLAGTYFLSEPPEAEATADPTPPPADTTSSDTITWPTAAAETAVPDTEPAPPSDDTNLDWLEELGPPQTNIFDTDADQSETNTDPFADDLLPDWMDELGPPQTGVIEPQPDETEPEPEAEAATPLPPPSLEAITDSGNDLPDWFAQLDNADALDNTLLQAPAADDAWLLENDFPAGTSSLDWLNVTGDLPPVSDAEPVSDEAIEFDQLDDSFMDTEPPVITESPDWLDEWVKLDTGELSPMDVAATGSDTDDNLPDNDLLDRIFGDAPAAQPLQPPADDLAAAPEPPAPFAESDTTAVPGFSTDSFLEAPIDSDLPDWLSKLEDATTFPDTSSVSNELINSDELPDWVSQMRPSGDQEAAGLATIIEEPDSAELGELDLFSDELDAITGDFAGTALPDWLRDMPVDSEMAAQIDSGAVPSDTPDWLRDDRDTAVAPPSRTTDAKQTTEWDAILGSLPPNEELAAADIPEWIQALRPKEIADTDEDEPAIETAGPLAGLANVVGIEPIIAQPRALTPQPAFAISKTQMKQAALLAQIANRTTGAATQTAMISPTTLAASLRILLALLLLAAILLGLLGPNVLQTAVPAPSARVSAAHDAIAANRQPVLVAFDYTPAMSGDLTAQATLLMAELADAGVPVLTMSQYAAGTMMVPPSETETAVLPLGFIPGEAIGLRQLGGCLNSDTPCRTLLGRSLDSDTQAALNNVGLIIIFTAERDSLVNWIEQVATPQQIPLVAGVSQSLAPVAAPYYASQQLTAVLHGLPDAAVYETAYRPNPDTMLDNQLAAQNLVQLIAATILLIGGLVMGITGTARSRRTEAKS